MSQKEGHKLLVFEGVADEPTVRGHWCHCSPSVCEDQCTEPLPIAGLPYLCLSHRQQGAPRFPARYSPMVSRQEYPLERKAVERQVSQSSALCSGWGEWVLPPSRLPFSWRRESGWVSFVPLENTG